MKKNNTSMGLALCVLAICQWQAPAAMASKSDYKSTQKPSKQYVLSLSGGAMWANPGTDQQFYLVPDVEKAYLKTNGTDTVANGEIFLGMLFNTPELQIHAGLAFGMNSSIGLSGDVLEDADPDFNNYFYHYKVRSPRLTAKAKLVKEISNGFAPYLSANAGIAFNYAHGFVEVPKIPQEVPHPFFEDNTRNTFTYGLGAGIQKSITEHFSMGIGYEFADLGKFELARAPGQTLGDGLRESKLHTHSAMLNVSFVA